MICSTNRCASKAFSAVFVSPKAHRASVAAYPRRPLQTARPTRVLVVRAFKETPKEEVAADVKKIGGITLPNLPTKLPNINVDISGLVRWNFVAQVALTAISWAVVFFSTHAGLAKGHNINLATVFLVLGVLLSAGSAFLSYGYFKKVQTSGIAVLEGLKTMNSAFDHMKINFLGIAVTLVAMQAEIGTLFVQSMTSSAAAQNYSSIAAMAQAGANILMAHVVSLVFLTMMVRKITGSTQVLVDWAEGVRNGLMGAIKA